MHFRIVAAALAAVFLAACGGGGGNPPVTMDPDTGQEPVTMDPDTGSETTPDEPEPEATRLPFPYQPAGHYRIDGLPAPTAADVRHMPIYRDNARTYVGVDQGPSFYDTFTVGSSIARTERNLANALPVVVERGDVEIRHGRIPDGVGSNVVSAYLSEASRGFTSMPRWRNLPEVRLVGTSNARERQLVISAIQLVNAALPESSKLSFGASSAPRDDGIDVEFVDCWGARHTCGGGSAAASTPSRISNAGDGERMADAHVYFSRETVSYPRDHEAVTLLAHELLHALGIVSHISEQFATIMEGTGAMHQDVQNGVRKPLSVLYSVDREALRALYSRLDVGDGPEDFGPWNARTWRIDGNGPHANFGVALRNGYAEPWAYGPTPATDLANNRSLSGSVTWEGALLGLTPQAAAVTGDAEIGVNLASMTGRADFTSLEAWPANTAPGAEGTGTQWLDGDLGYAITVRGNTFRETGGDTGRLTGIFTGPSHEGAAGTLERSDLTAAFGASR